MKHLTIHQFMERYPDDNVCLELIFKTRFGNPTKCPRCGEQATFYRISTRRCYECGKCYYHLYPMVGTIMQGSTTKLTTWFYAIYLFSISKNGISANELTRPLGVSFRTAWRIGHKIRQAMRYRDLVLKGTVEADETLLGGKAKGKRGWGAANKVCLLGMVEKNGNVKVVPLEHRRRDQIFPVIAETVERGSMIHTDEFKGYTTLPELGYEHRYVTHSAYQWRSGNVHTNSIEGYWSNLKKSILGTHTHVSRKHLQKYLDEFSFRYNNRNNPLLFDEILKNVMQDEIKS